MPHFIDWNSILIKKEEEMQSTSPQSVWDAAVEFYSCIFDMDTIVEALCAINQIIICPGTTEVFWVARILMIDVLSTAVVGINFTEFVYKHVSSLVLEKNSDNSDMLLGIHSSLLSSFLIWSFIALSGMLKYLFLQSSPLTRILR